MTASMFDPFAEAAATPSYDAKSESSLFDERPPKAEPTSDPRDASAASPDRRPGLIRSSSNGSTGSSSYSTGPSANGAGATGTAEQRAGVLEIDIFIVITHLGLG